MTRDPQCLTDYDLAYHHVATLLACVPTAAVAMQVQFGVMDALADRLALALRFGEWL